MARSAVLLASACVLLCLVGGHCSLVYTAEYVESDFEATIDVNKIRVCSLNAQGQFPFTLDCRPQGTSATVYYGAYTNYVAYKQPGLNITFVPDFYFDCGTACETFNKTVS